MAKAIAADVIVLNLDDELRFQRLPLRRAFRAPAARSARRIAREAWRLDEFLQFLR
jgi:hypothetical protein